MFNVSCGRLPMLILSYRPSFLLKLRRCLASSSASSSFNFHLSLLKIPHLMHTKNQWKLKDYQIEAIDAIHDAFERGIKRPAFVMATGGGKTVVFSHLIPQIPSQGDKNQVLVLAHTEELVRQAHKTISNINPDLEVDIEMQKQRPSLTADVIVASVQSLIRGKRLEGYDPENFKAIIIDECHHAVASSWIKILEHFKYDDPELKLVVVGCTATMERNDTESLGDVFEEIVFERDLLTMIENKELVDVKFLSIKANMDLRSVRKYKGDYLVALLGRSVNKAEVNTVVVTAYKKLKEETGIKSTLMFCVDVDHCKTLAAVFQSEGINAQYVTGTTVKHERKSIIEDFKAGTINVLLNVQVFTEGTDLPNIDSLFLVRPTKSRALLVQMIGRGLRLHENKTHCNVVDVVDTVGTGIRSVPSLFSLPLDYDVDGKSYTELKKALSKLQEEQQNQLEAEQKILEKEKSRKQIEAESIARMRELEDKFEKMALQFETYDGILAIEEHTKSEYRDLKDINQRICRDLLHWVRLEYATWGYSIDDRFLLLEKLDPADPEISGEGFCLYACEFASARMKKASNYACGKIAKKTKVMFSESLSTVLARALSIAATVKPKFQGKSRPSTKQLKYVQFFLASRARYYGHSLVDMEIKIADRVQTYNARKAGDLIFAYNYSANSLIVKWEVQKVFGLGSMERDRIRRVIDNSDNPESVFSELWQVPENKTILT